MYLFGGGAESLFNSIFIILIFNFLLLFNETNKSHFT